MPTKPPTNRRGQFIHIFPNLQSQSIMQNEPVENWNFSEDLTCDCCWNIKYAEQLRSTSMFPAVSMCEEWCVKPTSSCVWTVTLITVGTVSDSFTRSVSAVDCRDGQHVSASSHCTKMNLRSLSDRVCAALIRRWSHSMEVLCTHSITNRPATTNLPQ